MKKTILVLMLGILLVTGNLYAADGDLYVNGYLGVGTESPTAKLDVQATDTGAMNIVATKDAEAHWLEGSSILLNVNSANVGGRALLVDVNHTDNTPAKKGALGAANLKTSLSGSGTIGGVVGMTNQLAFSATTGNYNINDVVGNFVYASTGSDNAPSSRHTINNYTGIRSGLYLMKGEFIGTNWAHARFYDFLLGDPDSAVTNVTGLWIDKQTAGTNNRGLVLDGDGAGADIVFGDAGGSCRPSVYSIGGFVKAKNKNCEETAISPHDPETGEWIFYSKNLKTGKVKRVNMEKLVKAVEQLTGDTFMVETFEEIK